MFALKCDDFGIYLLFLMLKVGEKNVIDRSINAASRIGIANVAFISLVADVFWANLVIVSRRL